MYAGEIAATDPDRLAFVMAASGEEMTYGQFHASANRLAHLFRAQGLAEGDHVAFFMPNSLTVLVAYGAAERTGLQYTPVDFHLTVDEAAYIVDDCAARVVVTNSDVAAVASQLPARCPKVERWLMDTDGELPAGFERYSDAVADYPADCVPDERLGIAMMYSSGTTGFPKGIMRPLPGVDPKKPLAVYGLVGELVYRMREGLTLIQPGPLYHAGPQSSTSIALRLGGTSVIMDRFDARRFLELVQRYRVTHTVVVPTMMSRLLALPDEVRAAADTSSLEAVVHGAAPCPPGLKHAMIDWLGPIIYEYYGATEANGGCRVDSTEWLEHPGTVGKAYMGEIVIRDDEGTELPVGEAGQVWFRGNTNFVYWADDEKTAANRTGDGSMSTTGDIGYVDDEGYLYLTDRTAFMIISGGVNVYPQQVETVLADHPSVADVAVLGVPNDDLGEEVKAVVAVRPGITPGTDTERELIEYCRTRLSRIKVPRTVDFVIEVPRLATGKLNKRLLRGPLPRGRPMTDTLFRDSVRGYLQRHSPEAKVREVIDSESGTDRLLWRGLARDLGVQGLAVPEAHGGDGLHWPELLVVFQELGRSLACVPAFATLALAVPALRYADNDGAAAFLPGIASGDTVATLAVTESDGRWAADAVRCAATREPDGGWRLTGSKAFVPHGCSADLLVIAARTPSGPSLFTIDAGAPGLARTPMTTLDLTRPLARLDLESVQATPLGADGAAWPVLNRVLDVAAVAAAAEQLGVAERCLELSVDYARTRSQFGRLIGSFQAIKHRCADMLVEVEAARSATAHAGVCLAVTDPGPGEGDAASPLDPAALAGLTEAAAMAQVWCAPAAERVARETIQVHGGIGFTWEHPAHLYLRRAASTKLLFGDTDCHAERLLGALGVAS